MVLYIFFQQNERNFNPNEVEDVLNELSCVFIVTGEEKIRSSRIYQNRIDNSVRDGVFAFCWAAAEDWVAY